MSIKPHVLAALRAGESVVAEAAPGRTASRRWVLVSPRRGRGERGLPTYFVKDFEVPNEYSDNNYDIDESDLREVKSMLIEGEDELFAKLTAIIVNLELLSLRGESDYPI